MNGGTRAGEGRVVRRSGVRRGGERGPSMKGKNTKKESH